MNATTQTDQPASKPRQFRHPVLILIRGLPGSGKSYLATALRDTLGADNVLILDPDTTDYSSPTYLEHTKALATEGIEAKFHPYRYLRNQAYGGIEARKVIIWNQAFTDLGGFTRTIDNLQTYANDHSTRLPVLVVELTVSHEVAKARVAERAAQGGHDVDEANFARFIRDYASFADQNNATVTVNGEGDIGTAVAAVTTALSKLQ